MFITIILYYMPKVNVLNIIFAIFLQICLLKESILKFAYYIKFISSTVLIQLAKK